MSSSTAVSSNAFNFMSYLRNGVDPRTGQYTMAIELPDIKCNNLQGPAFPLHLFFSPLNRRDSGYGTGWNLQLTQFSPSSNVITLSTGEAFEVDGEDTVTKRLTMTEQKLQSFHLYRHGSNAWRVVHRSGLVEILEVRGSADQALAVPVHIYSPEGHGAHLDYTTFNGSPLLQYVRQDDNEPLLQIIRDGSSVRVLGYPDGVGGGLAEYQFALGADALVERIVLPSDPDPKKRGSWRMKYEKKNDFYCINRVETPTNAVETVLYQDEGHLFPTKSTLKALPRVTGHKKDPGHGQPVEDVRYTYPNDPDNPVKHNFLGYGLDIDWTKGNAQDALYQYVGNYSYGSVESLYENEKLVRSIERRFNQFHLSTLEKTTRGKSVSQTVLKYNLPETPTAFKDLPRNFQLPTETSRLSWLSGTTPNRPADVETSAYDSQGNLLSLVQANGVEEKYVWYATDEQAEGHPKDPEGFIRHLKEKHVIPAASAAGKAVTVINRYFYETLPALAGGDRPSLDPWYVVGYETLFEKGSSETERQRTVYDYERSTDKLWKFGRVVSKVMTMGGKATTSTYAYDLLPYVAKGRSNRNAAHVASPRAGEMVLQTKEKLTGFDGHYKDITTEHSVLHDLPLLNSDDQGVEIRYEYNTLRQTVREIVAPEKAYEAERRYAYELCAELGQQASQEAWDVKDVRTRTLLDGLQRPIEEYRQDKDNLMALGTDKLYLRYEASHSVFGDLASEAEIDWLDKKLLKLKSTFAYDDWGQLLSVTSPDGVKTVEQTDPFGNARYKGGPVQYAWREDAKGNKTGVTETWFNLFEKPVRVERFDRENKPNSLTVNEYDGLGRSAKETVGLSKLRVNEYRYDIFDRLVTHQLPSKDMVTREYASHSADDLPTKISVAGKVLGLQTFDGLGRRDSETTGGRKQTFAYRQGERQPWKATKYKRDPAQFDVIEYDYVPALGEEPVKRVINGIEMDTAKYIFDSHNARLTDFEVPGHVVHRTYFSTGEVDTETRTIDGELFEMNYRYSLLGRLESYTDVLKQKQLYRYDQYGRLEYTSLAGVTATFTYDDFGRTESYTTEGGGEKLVTTLKYDDFERESRRTFDFGDVIQTLRQWYNDVDGMSQRTLTEGPEDNEKVLRDERYDYDTSDRLTVYTCKGKDDNSMPEQPPEDSWRNKIYSQVFTFDAFNNIKTLTTTDTDKKLHRTQFQFTNAADPAQLTGYAHVPAGGSPQVFELKYDDYGNMTDDDQGLTMTYNALNQLMTATRDGETQHYNYDAKDILSGTLSG
ncbi:RHS repeat protein [Pseudomonas sp. S37]|uniref:RHS repeat domain-containing protein n=1 Tax=Pseudomonas sp. S37 TaxID=2767449 RepID=UPI001911C7BC|nr:RHS repeat protein [Pseudomonas sp. S37]MBK4996010.1 RHS repeat protein [Pseudomonas sp. S37]